MHVGSLFYTASSQLQLYIKLEPKMASGAGGCRSALLLAGMPKVASRRQRRHPSLHRKILKDHALKGHASQGMQSPRIPLPRRAAAPPAGPPLGSPKGVRGRPGTLPGSPEASTDSARIRRGVHEFKGMCTNSGKKPCTCTCTTVHVNPSEFAKGHAKDRMLPQCTNSNGKDRSTHNVGSGRGTRAASAQAHAVHVPVRQFAGDMLC